MSRGAKAMNVGVRRRFRTDRVGAFAWVLGLTLASIPGAAARADAPDAVPVVASPPVVVEPSVGPLLTPEELERILTEAEQRREHFRSGRRAPVDPTARPELVGPTSPETPVPGSAGAGGTRAAGTFTIFRDHILVDAETNDAVGMQAAEPSVGMNGRILWASGNWFAANSGSYGQNYTYVNPFTRFLPVPPGGFCCDQVVHYDRTHQLMFWYLQYCGPALCPSTANNIVRLAVSRGQMNQASNLWTKYDIPPSVFGYPSTAGFDFPDLALSAGALHITTNVTNHSDQARIIRISLDELAAGGGITLESFPSPLPNVRATQGAGSTMFYGTQVDSNTLRIFSWPDAVDSAGVTSVDRDVSAWFTGSTAPDPNGVDWIARDFNDILSSYVSGSNMVFMWDSAAGGAFAFPNIRIARFRTSDRMLVDQGQVWSSSTAWAYPAFHPNDRGDVGGTMTFGGGGSFPSMVVAIADTFGGSQTGPFDNVTVANSNQSATSNRWGDYCTARRSVPYGNTWLATCYVIRSEEPGGSKTQEHIVWFGREQDQPPANHTIRVDAANTDAWEDGTSAHPYNTVNEGHFATVEGDTVIIQAGSYPETLTLDRPSTIEAQGGNAVVGQ
jgi:hypothetical protein